MFEQKWARMVGKQVREVWDLLEAIVSNLAFIMKHETIIDVLIHILNNSISSEMGKLPQLGMTKLRCTPPKFSES